MTRLSLLIAAALTASTTSALAAEPIVGNWKTEAGDTAVIAACATGYCITLKTGKFAGRQIGAMAGKGGNYAGEITDPAANKTYSGSGTVSGDTVKMKGCAMKVFCRSQTWTRL
jgi:uncharacterized protein (DUF2147 family)